MSMTSIGGSHISRSGIPTERRADWNIPLYFLSTEVNLNDALHWLEFHNARRVDEPHVPVLALVLKATALAVGSAPTLNGFIEGGEFRVLDQVHLGVAEGLAGGGEQVETIERADQRSLDEIAAWIRASQRRRLTGERVEPGVPPTLTAMNLGIHGVDVMHGMLFRPQVALIGFGPLHGRPRRGGHVSAPLPRIVVSLTADRRASDPHVGARFMETLAALLRQPRQL